LEGHLTQHYQEERTGITKVSSTTYSSEIKCYQHQGLKHSYHFKAVPKILTTQKNESGVPKRRKEKLKRINFKMNFKTNSIKQQTLFACNSLFLPPNTSQVHQKPHGEKCDRILPFSCTGVDRSFDADAFSALALIGHCSAGRMTSDLGFSLGIKRASAFGVLGSSSSLKNGTCIQEAIKIRYEFKRA
jgi:hypothetical protein